MLWLQSSGCHNINFVSPSHVVSQILDAVLVAAKNGLNIPLVYNTGGFDSLEALELLDGVIDIYMPDMKYSDSKIARRMSKIGNYPGVNKRAIKEMHRQVGDLTLDERGIAQRGLLIRHLVLPGGMAGSAKILKFLAEDISTNTYINIMAQYRPAFRAMDFPHFDRPVTRKEYTHVLELARKYGLHRLDSRNR
jgi:putative pyruvate formate lyase activating enzyme